MKWLACCLQEIKAVGTELSITPVIIRGEELKQKGFGGTVHFSVKYLPLNNNIYRADSGPAHQHVCEKKLKLKSGLKM